MMRKGYILLFFIFFTSFLYAHLCDNVFRQANSLIVKPETYSLVVKDRTSFKIFLQNNMDRGIAEISLIPESPAFDFEVTPKKMSIPKDRQVYFEVTLIPKSGIRTGNYPVKFRLVGGGREFKSFTLEGLAEAANREKSTDLSKLPVVKSTYTSPVIDGSFNDECWKASTILSNFCSLKGPEAIYKTWVMMTFDRNNLYIGVFCRDEDVEKLSSEDRVEIIISPAGNGNGFIMSFSPSGTPIYKKYDSAKQVSQWDASEIKWEGIKKETYWSMEIAIPLHLIKTPKEKEVWDIRINRIKASGNKETSFWAMDSSGYHQEKEMGKVVLLP
ncbi:MAG: hypothetical protein N3D17_07490 [bacterium]|nr:hypothetical protein [bacterium]